MRCPACAAEVDGNRDQCTRCYADLYPEAQDYPAAQDDEDATPVHVPPDQRAQLIVVVTLDAFVLLTILAAAATLTALVAKYRGVERLGAMADDLGILH